MLTIKEHRKELSMIDQDYEKWINSFLQEQQQSNKVLLSQKEELKKKKQAVLTLQQILQREIPEMSDEFRKRFHDFALTKIFDLMVGVSANNLNDVKSGVMLMCILLDAPSAEKNKPEICAPFANHLRNVNFSISDLELLDLIACAVGKIALNSGSSTPNFVEFEIRRAIELIGNERVDFLKRHSAILNLRELATVTPSYFFNHVMPIFRNIFIAINDSKLREAAILALRAALHVVVERERLASISASKTATRFDVHIPKCFELCYKEAISGFEERDKQPKDRDEKIHASLLIINELFRCSYDPSAIIGDSLNRQLDFLHFNLADANTYFFFSYLCNHFDYSILLESMKVNLNSNINSVSNSGSSSITSNQHQSKFSLSNSGYLTKLFRNYSNVESSNIPLYGLRDLHSVVSYHKETGLAPILSMFYKNKSTNLSASCQNLIFENFDIICDHIILLLKLKNSIQINHVLLIVLPSLVSLNAERFVLKKNYLNESIQYLLSCTKSPNLKSSAFISLGLFVLAVKDFQDNSFNKNLPMIVQHIRSSFPIREQHQGTLKKRHNWQQNLLDPAIFTCLACISQAFGSKIKDEIEQMLPYIFSMGLTGSMANCLYDICRYIPKLKDLIHSGLLKLLSLIIMDKSLKQQWNNFQISPAILQAIQTAIHSSQESFNNLDTLKLALKILGRFEFKVDQLTNFVKHCAENFLDHDNREIRLEAVHTCCNLLKPFLSPRNSREQMTKNVLRKLLIVASSDLNKYVRYSVLSQLDEEFDYYLAQAENLESLQLSVNDEVFEIRELSICILCRLSSLNPAFVMPFLRTTLMQFLIELEITGLPKNMEQSARMLGHLLAGTPQLVRPYTEPILKVFLPKISDSCQTQAVVTAVLSAIGEQAIVSGLEMRPYFYQLFPVMLEAIQDITSFQKREIALWTMGRLVENCGFVIEPYKKHQNLIEILFSILKSESTKSSQLIRRETIRVLGLLGAVDPYWHKMNLGYSDLDGESLISYDPALEQEGSSLEMLGNQPNDDFYSTQAINTLVQVMKDPNASTHHTMAVQAVAFIFNVLKVRSVPYLKEILPPFINIIRTGEPRTKEFLLQHLGQIILVVKKHIRSYLDEIFKVLRELWISNNSQIQLTLFYVIDQIALSLGSDFRKYIPHLIPHVLKVLKHDPSPGKEVTLKLLNALQNFGNSLEDYFIYVIGPVLDLVTQITPTGSNLVEMKDIDKLRTAALKTIDAFCSDDLDLSSHSTKIVHAIIKCIDMNFQDKKLVKVALETLTKLVWRLGVKYNVYASLVSKMINKHKLQNEEAYRSYEILVDKIQIDFIFDMSDYDNLSVIQSINIRKQNLRKIRDPRLDHLQPVDSYRKFTLEDLKSAWSHCARRISKEDWIEWLRMLNIDLIKESPSLALRSCYPIAQSCNNVARDLFNHAFLSCWNELNNNQQKELINLLEETMKEQEIPEVTGTLLNLAEFLEHIDQGPLIFDVKLLAERAIKCRAYAKALHYKEKEFMQKPTTDVLGALITINNKLQQPQAAYGCLMYAMKSADINDIEVKEKWFEKLHNYESAYQAYRSKYEQDVNDFDSIVGQMRCLELLSEWEDLYDLAESSFKNANDDQKQQFARIAVNATWALNKWDEMIEYSQHIPKKSPDFAFYKAVIKIHQSEFGQAQFYIDEARQLIDTELTTMAGESYNRAYPAMVQVQLMSELEEVIQYKLVPERREMIKKKWWNRLLGCQRQVEDWQKILQVHSLVLTPREDMHAWLKFAKLCERSNRPDLSFKTIVKLMEIDPTTILQTNQPLPLVHPEITLHFIDHIWLGARFKRAFIELHHFIQTLENESSHFILQTRLGVIENSNDSGGMDSIESLNFQTMNYNEYMYAHVKKTSSFSPETINKILARAYLKQANWEEFLFDFSEQTIPSILDLYQKATMRDNKWYKAWHAWAFMNFRALKYCKEKQVDLVKNLDASMINFDTKNNDRLLPKEFAINAVKGFFKSVALSKTGSSLQDTLRILTILFEDGYNEQVRSAVEEGIKSVSIETWLRVIPQLIARIDIPHLPVAKLIHHLLTDIGKYHPQALIYPLTVAAKSSNLPRSQAANSVLHLMRNHSSNLVKQAVMVSDELIRIAILWHELWHEGLEEASRLYFGDKNVEAMFDTLEPLHKMIERTPVTYKELTFVQNYGADLNKAYQYCQKYKVTRNNKYLNDAWDIYYHVFRRISKQLPQLTSLELEYVSPKLTECINLELAVPGSYAPLKEVIRIAKVKPQLNIITSKQRPRKLTIIGSNGYNYMFLLKGHEDLRQDERVMQLFSLVNTLLNSENSTSRQNLAIQRYAVIPLSPNSGLIGWVPCCDTLHSLIRDYREKRKILLNMEHRLMLRMAPDYDRLTLMQKVEVFEHALEHTLGDDLAKILWLRSPSSEVWFDRRTNYSRSLAVMSMVGYILGLGDRHPSNLMLDRNSGKILHIDFGDCFEVAMTREKYPEKIPFRLTRMLINAMEVTGLNGTYRLTCQQVMLCLRKNKESLMALLEAFVYDPLLNWRLIESQPKLKPTMERTEFMADLNKSVENINLLASNSIRHHPPGHLQRQSSIQRITSIQLAEKKNDYYSNEGLNSKAVAVINRVQDKLTGHDFYETSKPQGVIQQVDMLIMQATSHENLCQCYIGWCPFW